MLYDFSLSTEGFVQHPQNQTHRLKNQHELRIRIDIPPTQKIYTLLMFLSCSVALRQHKLLVRRFLRGLCLSFRLYPSRVLRRLNRRASWGPLGTLPMQCLGALADNPVLASDRPEAFSSIGRQGQRRCAVVSRRYVREGLGRPGKGLRRGVEVVSYGR
jgi:hypothetical protein